LVSLRVGLLCHRGVGGSARIAVDLGNALGARGHTVHLFARTLPLGIETFGQGVTFHPLRDGDGHAPATALLDEDWSAPDLDTLVERVGSVVRSPGLDVLHFHYAIPFAWVAAQAVRRLGGRAPRLVGTLHGTDVSVHGCSPKGPSVARDLAQADRLTTVSRSHVRLATVTFSLPTPPDLIPNFVDVGRFRPTNGRVGESAHPRRIVHVSNFRPVKDPASVVRVFARVRRDLDAELWLVGDGEAMPAVRSAVHRAGVGPHVRFFSLHPAVERVLPHADILLLTSRAESFCLAALEAAACGVPAVAPRIGGLPEVVAHGETGLLFRPTDEAEAARAVLSLLDDREAHARMKAEAARRARRFSTETMVPRYERVYRALLDGRTEALPRTPPTTGGAGP
jgi:N-acetyl-alpha-D-glucosaminyl L-malate synthase BshA